MPARPRSSIERVKPLSHRLLVASSAVLICAVAAGLAAVGPTWTVFGRSLAIGGAGAILVAVALRRWAAVPGGRLGPLLQREDLADDALVTVGSVRELLAERSGDAADEASRLHRVIAHVGEVIIDVDARGMIVVANRAAEVTLGVEPLLGRAFEDAATQNEVRELVTAARGGRAADARVRLSTPEGTRTFLASARPLGPGAAVLTMRDITELANAVKVRTEFVANASHELRTPIAAIRAAVETLELDDEPNPVRAKLQRVIGVQARRIEEMVADLLDLSRLDSGGFRVEIAAVRIGEMLAQLPGLFERICRERNLQIAWELSPDAEVFHSDARLLQLILRNLVENSTKFAYADTIIRISVARSSSGGLLMEVTDRGIGIPLMHQARVFEPYFQVDQARTGSSQRGTGLGLSIVRQAAAALGGTVRLQSVWKEGTKVAVELPGPAGQRTGAKSTPAS